MCYFLLQIQSKESPSTMATSNTTAAADQTTTKTPIQILDLTKDDENAAAKCLVECKETNTYQWMTIEAIRESYPRLLIDYYESRMSMVPKPN